MRILSVVRLKVLANLVGAALTLFSTFVPWIRYSDGQTLSAVQAQDAWLTAALVISGGIVSLFSSYGGLLTTAGLWRFVAAPPVRFLFVASNVVITYSFETGVWLGWAGSTISLIGSPWILPFGLPKTEADRKKFGTTLFPIGVVATVFGTVLSLPGSIVLSLIGLIILAISIVLFLPARGQPLG